jgi:hypothetical protein
MGARIARTNGEIIVMCAEMLATGVILPLIPLRIVCSRFEPRSRGLGVLLRVPSGDLASGTSFRGLEYIHVDTRARRAELYSKEMASVPFWYRHCFDSSTSDLIIEFSEF